MKKTAVILTTGIFFSGFIALSQCSKHQPGEHMGMGTEAGSAPKILSVTPTDGSDSVDVNTPVTVRFDRPMDTLSCMENFELHMGYQSSHPGEGMDGHFEWDSAMTCMSFTPGDSLGHQMDYTVHMGQGMMSQMMEHMMGGDMNSMMGGGSGMESDMYYHFRTR